MSRFTFFRIGMLCLCVCCTVWKLSAQQQGCTDPRARNFQPDATVNDGSCVYARASVKPYATLDLPPVVNGTSGLLLLDSGLYTHNDHRDRTLYRLDTADAHVLSVIRLGAMAHRDLEDAAQDSLYVYLGDFGNNAAGNRTDLHILRLLKSTLHDSIPLLDTLWFSYPDQTDSLAVEANRSDFDCEAMLAVGDSLYLFTKQWTRHATTLYALPKIPGRHLADSLDTYLVDGLITSASYDEAQNRVVLCGYSPLLQPFLLLLYDYPGHRFLSGNKRKIHLDLPFHQVEAVEHIGGNTYFLSNERFRRGGLNVPARLHKLDLSDFLSVDEEVK